MELITHLHVAGVSAGDICWAYALQQLDDHKQDNGAKNHKGMFSPSVDKQRAN